MRRPVARSAVLPASCGSQDPVQEGHRAGVGVQSIGEPGQAVSLVGVDQQLAGDAAAPHRGDQLLGLGQRDAWVLGAVDDEERCADRVGPAQRRGGGEEVAVGGEGAVIATGVQE